MYIKAKCVKGETYMSNIKFCSIIIKDDFNNILISKKEKEKKQMSTYGMFLKEKIKGRETPEKCANRAIKEDLKP